MVGLGLLHQVIQLLLDLARADQLLVRVDLREVAIFVLVLVDGLDVVAFLVYALVLLVVFLLDLLLYVAVQLVALHLGERHASVGQDAEWAHLHAVCIGLSQFRGFSILLSHVCFQLFEVGQLEVQSLVFFLLPVLKNFINSDCEFEIFVQLEVPAGCN